MRRNIGGISACKVQPGAQAGPRVMRMDQKNVAGKAWRIDTVYTEAKLVHGYGREIDIVGQFMEREE